MGVYFLNRDVERFQILESKQGGYLDVRSLRKTLQRKAVAYHYCFITCLENPMEWS